MDVGSGTDEPSCRDMDVDLSHTGKQDDPFGRYILFLFGSSIHINIPVNPLSIRCNIVYCS